MNILSRLLQQRYVIYALIILLLLLTIHVIQRGIGSVIVHEATYELENNETLTPDSEAMQQIEDRLLLAWRLMSQHPDISEELGTFYMKQAAMRKGDLKAQDADYEKALMYFTDSALQRPVSPFAWANIVLLKFFLGQEDEQFRQAIHNATLLGVNTREVQRIVGEVGLASWKRLNAQGQDDVTAILRQMLVSQPKELIRIAQFHRRLDVICTLQQLEVCKEPQQQ